MIRLQRPKAEKAGRLLAFRGRADIEDEIRRLKGQLAAYTTAVRALQTRLDELEATSPSRTRRAR